MLKKILYLWGFSSLIFLPYINGLKPADIFTILTFFVVLFFFIAYITTNKIYTKISFSVTLLYFITVLYITVTIIGSILNAYDGFVKSLLVAIRYYLTITIIFLLFILSKFNYEKVNQYFIYFVEGLIQSGILNVLWIIVDQVFFYIVTPSKSVNELLFHNLNSNLEHVLTNRYLIMNIYLLRSSGLGWDPGGIGPALLICYILSDILGKSKKIKILLFIGILLTLSRTTYLALIIYFIIIFFMKNLKVNIFLITSAVIFSFFLINQFVIFISPADLELYFEEGTIRHIKYFSELYNLIYANLAEILFGYGYRGTGEFFNKYVPWIYENHGFYFDENTVSESTLTNLFLYGGMLGGIYNLFLYFSLLIKEKTFKVVIIMLIILYFGYTFENIWTFVLVYFLWFLNLIKKKKVS